jgi:hypothetical protein
MRATGYAVLLICGSWLATVGMVAFQSAVEDGSVAALAQQDDPRANSAKIAPPSSQRALGWSQERMLGAQPLPVPQVDPSQIKKGPRPPPTDAGQSGTGISRDLGPGNPKMSGDASSIPLRWAGKLFYTEPSGDYVCSGQFITNRVILTAAHCLRDDRTGQWYDEFNFRLQYDRGRASQSYTYECVATKQGWIVNDGGQWRWDIGMILVRSNSTTGHFGYHYGWSLSEYPAAPKIGYPADILNGQVVQVDSGALFFPDGEEDIIGLRHGNPRNAGGSSGGAWVGKYSNRASVNVNFVIGVTSHHRGKDTSISYSPYFKEDNFKSLLDYTSRGCKNR